MFYEEAIADDQRDVLKLLGPVASEHNFYLAGGTAVAIHLGHRRSVDFDWFRSEPFSDPMEWAQALRDRGVPFDTISVDEGTLHGSISGVRTSFFEYSYPLLSYSEMWSEYETRLASLDDLACMKLVAIAQRGTKKDFVDLHAICKQHRPLAELLCLYEQKYRTDDIAHLLYALTYFDDADSERMPTMLWDIDWHAVRGDIRTWVQEIDA